MPMPVMVVMIVRPAPVVMVAPVRPVVPRVPIPRVPAPWIPVPRVVIPAEPVWPVIPRIPPQGRPGERPRRGCRQDVIVGIPGVVERVVRNGYRTDIGVVEIDCSGFVLRNDDRIRLLVAEKVDFGTLRTGDKIVYLLVAGFRIGCLLFLPGGLAAGIIDTIIEPLSR